VNRKENYYWDMYQQIYEDINSFGRNENGGMDRLAFSEEDNKAHDYLARLATEVGFLVKQDGAANLWITAKGSDESLPPIYVGSHLDTVPDGGRFDGTLGVLTAFHAMLLLQQYAPKRSVTLLVFRCEESSRFSCATIGSKALAGILHGDRLKQYQDNDNISLFEAMENAGGKPALLPEGLTEERKLLEKGFGFVELHIEQGPVLETSHTAIGIVEAIAAPYRIKVQVNGMAAHSGACPMHHRADALTGAAEMILAVERLGRQYAEQSIVATVGNCVVPNGAINIVPGSVEFPVDIRGIDGTLLKQVAGEIIQQLKEIGEKRGLTVQLQLLSAEEPVKLSSKIADLMEQTCREIGVSSVRMNSGAGQDTMYMAQILDAGICFVPCIKGISHNRLENVTEETMLDGLEFMTELLRRSCCRC